MVSEDSTSRAIVFPVGVGVTREVINKEGVGKVLDSKESGLVTSMSRHHSRNTGNFQ
jgi:hypothetical protein